jgi:hypothetical protein
LSTVFFSDRSTLVISDSSSHTLCFPLKEERSDEACFISKGIRRSWRSFIIFDS